MERIRLNGYPQEDRSAVEMAVARAVEKNPDYFIDKYKQDPRSFGGRYVNSDLFKETFEQYAASNETRCRYNFPVHNASAVLASEQFNRVLTEKIEPNKDIAIFLTGTPGSGKTTSVMRDNQLPEGCHMLYEGQLADSSSIDKIQKALDAGLKPKIVVVHPLPEKALENAFKRFDACGRGASIHVISKIQGELPDGLQKIHEKFGNKVSFTIIDKRDFRNSVEKSGWDNINTLRSEGNREQIKERLSIALEQHRQTGRISDDCYRQAAGESIPAKFRTVGEGCDQGFKSNGCGRGIQERDRKENLLDRPKLVVYAGGIQSGKSTIAAVNGQTPQKMTHEGLMAGIEQKRSLCVETALTPDTLRAMNEAKKNGFDVHLNYAHNRQSHQGLQRAVDGGLINPKEHVDRFLNDAKENYKYLESGIALSDRAKIYDCSGKSPIMSHEFAEGKLVSGEGYTAPERIKECSLSDNLKEGFTAKLDPDLGLNLSDSGMKFKM